MGAIWSRIWTGPEKGYGYIDDQTPELGIAINPEHRNKGLGRSLIELLADQVAQAGLTQLSLSVDRRNRAMKLYVRLGFEVYASQENTCTMIKKFKKA